MDPTRLNEHSERCVPAFAVVGTGPDPTQPGSYQPLGVHWSERFWPTPGPGEMLRGRYTCLAATGVGLVDPDGLPARSSERHDLASVELFEGAGLVVVTDRRVGGLLITGRSAVAAIDGDAGHALVFSVPFEEVRQVGFARERRALGSKPRRLAFSLRDGGNLTLDLDRLVDDDRRARRFDSTALLDQIATLVATRTRTGATTPATPSAPSIAHWPPTEARRDQELASASSPVPEPPRPLPHPTTSQPPPGCPACGTAPRPAAKFCHRCGQALTPEVRP